MATTPVRQSSFEGEIAPDLYGRSDHPRYGKSLRRMVNCFSTPGAAAKNRAGTRFVASTKGNGVAIRIPVVLSSSQAYMLEFGNLYVRFVRNGALVLNAGVPFELVTPFTTAMLPYLQVSPQGKTLTVTYGGQFDGGVGVAPQDIVKTGAADTAWSIAPTVIYFDAQPSTGESFSLRVEIFAWAGGTTYQMGDRVTGNNQEYVSLQNNNTGNALPAAGASNTFWTLANDNLHPGVSFSWAQTAVVQDLTTGVVYESKASASSPVSYVGPRSKDRPIKLKLSQYDNPGNYKVLYYRLYGGLTTNAIYGWLNDIPPGQTFFLDEGIAPDYTEQPPASLVTQTATNRDPFIVNSIDNWPGSVTHFEQRRMFARSSLFLMDIWGSKSGDFFRWDRPRPVVESTAINFTLASDQFDEIRALLPQRELLALTQSGLYAIRGFQGDPLSASSVDAKKHSSIGSSWVRPARTGSFSFAYVPEGQSGVVEASFDYNINLWVVNDLSVTASHLFDGHTIVALAFARRPYKILWAVRDDGVLLGMSRSPDGAAWHRHTTDGLVEDVCVLPEGTEDAVYMGVKRAVNGAMVRYHERMASRLVTDLRLGVFLDSSIQSDGRNVLATTMKFTSDSGVYGGGEEGVILASAASFVGATDIGDQIVFDPDAAAGGPFRLTILDYTDSTHVRAQLDQPLAAAFRNIASASWAFARDAITGLDHLEGKSVMVLADGDTQGPYTVNGGSITLVPPAVIAQIGLSYQPLLELLDVPEDGKQKTVQAVTLKLSESRGVKAGESETNLFGWDSQRTVEVGYGPIPMFTGQVKIRIQDGVGVDGRCVVVQDEPLPMTITGLKRELSAGGEL